MFTCGRSRQSKPPPEQAETPRWRYSGTRLDVTDLAPFSGSLHLTAKSLFCFVHMQMQKIFTYPYPICVLRARKREFGYDLESISPCLRNLCLSACQNLDRLMYLVSQNGNPSLTLGIFEHSSHVSWIG